jgi:hypothetical protein
MWVKPLDHIKNILIIVIFILPSLRSRWPAKGYYKTNIYTLPEILKYIFVLWVHTLKSVLNLIKAYTFNMFFLIFIMYKILSMYFHELALYKLDWAIKEKTCKVHHVHSSFTLQWTTQTKCVRVPQNTKLNLWTSLLKLESVF